MLKLGKLKLVLTTSAQAKLTDNVHRETEINAIPMYHFKYSIAIFSNTFIDCRRLKGYGYLIHLFSMFVEVLLQ